MKKINSKDLLINFFYIITFLIIYLFLTKNNHLFASYTDFRTQHYLIPEYLRTNFYETLNLFPDFALNLGSGQNIYYLSYYGLFNPYILISYLFPQVKMINYLITVNCLIVIASTELFYFYLKKHHYQQKTCFITAFLFLVSSPLIFHAKRHIMFINYLPFLITALFSIDNYIEKKHTTLLTISIILIILSSYYFSITSLLVLYLYYLYQTSLHTKHPTPKTLIQQTIKIMPTVLLSISTTAILILPTAYTLLNGRDTNSPTTISLKTLITPQTISNLLYNPYSLGLTIISLISLIYLSLKANKETKILSITCLLIITFPLFNYLLNGTLYINSKSLIPFLPLILILTAIFLDKYFQTTPKKFHLPLIIYLLIVPFSICLLTNKNDKLLTKQNLYNQENQITNQLITNITQTDPTLYRINTQILPKDRMNKIVNSKHLTTSIYSSTENKYYQELYQNILNNPLPNRNKFTLPSANNLISQILLNEKYIITKENLNQNIYTLVTEKQDIKLYQNTLALPLAYASNTLTFSKNNTTTTNLTNILNNLNIPLTKTYLTYHLSNPQNLTYQQQENYLEIKAQNKASLNIDIEENLNNKILILQLDLIKNPNYDTSITINNITNTLTAKNWKYHNHNSTFHYLITSPQTLNITLLKGTYHITNIKTYLIDIEDIKNITTNIDSLKIDSQNTKGNKIAGTINITQDNSYFTLSIPYDKGFTIKIDNTTTPYQKSTTNLITFPIKKGTHNISITYHAPYKNISLLISTLSLIIIILKTISHKLPTHQ